MIFYIFTCILHLPQVYCKLPVGLIAKLVEHCWTLSQRSWVSILFRPEFSFSGFNFTTALVLCTTAATINHTCMYMYLYIILWSSNILVWSFIVIIVFTWLYYMYNIIISIKLNQSKSLKHTNMSLDIHYSKLLVGCNHSQTFFVHNKDRPIKTMCLKGFWRQVQTVFKFEDSIVLSNKQERKRPFY